MEIFFVLFNAFIDEVRNHPISFLAWLLVFLSVIVRNYKVRKALALIGLGLIALTVVLVISGQMSWYYQVRLVNYFTFMNALVYGFIRFVLALCKMAITWELANESAPLICLVVCTYSVFTNYALPIDVTLVNWDIAKFYLGGWVLLIFGHFSNLFLNNK